MYIIFFLFTSKNDALNIYKILVEVTSMLIIGINKNIKRLEE